MASRGRTRFGSSLASRATILLAGLALVLPVGPLAAAAGPSVTSLGDSAVLVSTETDPTPDDDGAVARGVASSSKEKAEEPTPPDPELPLVTEPAPFTTTDTLGTPITWEPSRDAETGELLTGLESVDAVEIAAVEGSIAGTVTDEISALPLEGVLVTAHDVSAGGTYAVTTAADGTYSIPVPTGWFAVIFADHVGSHVAESWDNMPAIVDYATFFEVSAGESVTGIDAALAPGGTISGVVTDTSGEPLEGVCVSVHAGEYPSWGGGCTDASGFYRTTGVPAGDDYFVWFQDENGPHVSQVYDGVTWGSPGATPVSVTVGNETTGINAAMVRGGTFSGVVTDAQTGAPIEGATVYVHGADGEWFGGRETDATGAYRTQGLEAGSYVLRFAGTYATGHFTEYYDDAPDQASAQVLGVELGEDVTGIDAALQLGGSITGVISDRETGEAVPGACVYASDVANESYSSACADDAGVYALRGMRTGSYTVEFSDYDGGHLRTWYLDQASRETATPVDVVVGEVTAGINQTMVLGGSIVGTVTDAVDGGGASDVSVYAYPVGDSVYTATGYTDATGAYSVKGLPAGDYEVRFAGGTSSKYRETWFDGAFTRLDADPVSVQGGATTTVDQALQRTGSISGFVTNASTGEPIETGWVTVYTQSGNSVSYATVADGHYTAWGLEDAEYLVKFGATEMPSVWFDSKPTQESADPVSVSLGVATTGVDQALPVGGRITGNVTDEVTGERIDYAFLQISDTAGNLTYVSAYDGTFSVQVLSGEYTVKIEAEDYTPEYYDNVAYSTDATVVNVTDGETVALEIALTPNSTISGTVTDETGNPVFASVWLFTAADTTSAVAYKVSDPATGDYRITAPPGQYVLRFSDAASPGTFGPEYYNDKATAGTADILRIDAGVDHLNVDAVLEPGGIISGALTAPAGSDTSVWLRNVETGEWIFGNQVGTDGTWRSVPLATGTYTVQFIFEDGSTRQTVWYDGVSDLSDATAIPVAAGETVTGVDMAFVGDIDISGRVTDLATGTPQDDVGVYAFVPGSNDRAGYDQTDPLGMYTIVGLEPGTYEVFFVDHEYDSDDFLRSEWYSGSVTREGATSVVVTGDEPATGIDAALSPGGSISGRITDDVTGIPVAACATVEITVLEVGSLYRDACADTEGNYRVGGLPTGSYRIYFHSATYLDEYWDNASYSDATLVDVIDGEDTPDIDAALTLGGSVSGRVIDAATGLPLSSIRVYASGTSTSGQWSSGDAYTGTDGRFTISGLSAGDHRVEFENYNGRYLTQWYDGARTYDTATLVSVNLAEEVTGIDAAMRLTVVDSSMGSVFGVVTDAVSGDALEGICAYLYQDGSYTGMGTCTEADGWYELQGVQPGTYEVGFSDPSGLYETQYSDPVEVVAGAGSEVPMAMGAIRTVAGLVTDAGTGEPLEGVCAYLYEQGTWNTVGASCTAEDGRIVMQDVPTGTYELAFADTAGTHHTQWYSGAASRDAAAPITIGSATVITDANAAMAPITSVIGLVTDEQTGELLEGVCAYLYPVGSDSSVIGSCTEADGRIVMQGMAPGSYELAFADTTALHATEWFGDSTTRDGATTIELKEGTIVTDAHAAMAPITTVVGQVTDAASGDPLAGVCAYLYPVGSEESAGASCTFDDGRIAIQGFPQGEYVIGFADTSGLRATEWYGGSYNRADATVIDLTTAWARLDLDVAMDFTGSVTGLVTDQSGEPQADVCVYAGNLDGTYTGIGSCTDATGSFTLMGLNPVDVKLGYYPPGMDSPTTWWYDAQTTEKTATPVTVPAGAVATLTTQAIS